MILYYLLILYNIDIKNTSVLIKILKKFSYSTFLFLYYFFLNNKKFLITILYLQIANNYANSQFGFDQINLLTQH